MALIPRHGTELSVPRASQEEEEQETASFCPLCLRPFDQTPAAASFTPQYFRALPRHALLCDDVAESIEPDDDVSEAGFYAKYFVELHKAGHGSFGGVFVVRHVVEGITLGMFAVKKIPIGNSSEYLRTAINEVRLLEELHHHPNIIEYKHSWIETDRVADFGPRVRCLFVLMELATEGSLDRYLQQQHGRRMSNTAVWYFFLSALTGLAYLHSNHILHRDIKIENILLTKDEDGRPPRVMLSDFGTAVVFGKMGCATTSSTRSGGTGTEDYMAPELKLVDECGILCGEHSTASDVWAMGQVLHFLAYDGTLADVAPTTGTVRIRETCKRPAEMRQLILSMMDPEPSRRPSCAAILATPQCKSLMVKFERNEWDDTDELPTQRQLLLQDSLRRAGSVRRLDQLSTPPCEMTPTEAPSTPVRREATHLEGVIDGVPVTECAAIAVLCFIAGAVLARRV